MGILSHFGIGPKMGMGALPWLAATIVFSIKNTGLFIYSSQYFHFVFLAGIVLMIIGIGFYFSTLILLFKGLKETRLVTNGSFHICQNPLYASFLLLIIPALSFILNSWLVLTTSIVGYIFFRIFINNEYEELENKFGEEYRKYKNETPELFPFKVKKLIFINPRKKKR